MVTFHPTNKQVVGGFIPMVILRNSKGQCVGSRTPQGGAKEDHTFATAHEATLDATMIVDRVVAKLTREGLAVRVAA